MVKGTLKTFYGHFPEQVPNELWLHAGLLGDGFSGECQRMGGDKDLQAKFYQCFFFHLTMDTKSVDKKNV